MVNATVRAAALSGWDPYISSIGVHATSLSAVDRAGSSMLLQDFVRFSEKVVKQTRNIAIPWLVGVRYDLALLDTIGEAIMSAGRVGTALTRMAEYFTLLQDCTELRLVTGSTHAVINYRILDPDIWPRHHDAMFTLGIVSQILRASGEDCWDQVEFAFEAQQGDLGGDIAQVVRAPCIFGADTNQIRFPAALLDLAQQPARQPLDRGALNRRLVEKRRTSSLMIRLADLVYRDLNCIAIDQERIAREVGMSGRTLRRRLAEEGTSFQRILDECRMRQAAFEFRARPDLSIAQIALRLGYAEHSTFTRAFHRWSGVAPQVYRARLAVPAH